MESLILPPGQMVKERFLNKPPLRLTGMNICGPMSIFSVLNGSIAMTGSRERSSSGCCNRSCAAVSAGQRSIPIEWSRSVSKSSSEEGISAKPMSNTEVRTSDISCGIGRVVKWGFLINSHSGGSILGFPSISCPAVQSTDIPLFTRSPQSSRGDLPPTEMVFQTGKGQARERHGRLGITFCSCFSTGWKKTSKSLLFGIIVGTVYFLALFFPPVSPARHCPHR